MAEVAYTVTIPKDKNERNVYGALLISWLGLSETDDIGEPFDLANYNEKTVQISGDDGTGGTVRLEGTNIPDSVTDADYVVLTSKTDGSDLVGTTAAILAAVHENPLRVRPRVTAGTSVVMDVRLLVHSNRS